MLQVEFGYSSDESWPEWNVSNPYAEIEDGVAPKEEVKEEEDDVPDDDEDDACMDERESLADDAQEEEAESWDESLYEEVEVEDMGELEEVIVYEDVVMEAEDATGAAEPGTSRVSTTSEEVLYRP